MGPAAIPSVNGRRRCSKRITDVCRANKGWWPEAGFSPKKGGSGFHSHCRDCRREIRRSYGRKHKVELAAALKKWQAENPERTKELRRNWYRANRDHELRKSSTFKAANPVLYRGYQRFRMAKLNSGPRLTDAEWAAVVAICGSSCLKCGANVDVTIDHIVPITKGGTDTKDNVQPLCHRCNSSKKCKVIDYRSPEARRILGTKEADVAKDKICQQEAVRGPSRRHRQR